MKRITVLFLVILFSCLSYDVVATTYYNKSTGTGALQTLSNWGTNTDGTGTAPSNFTTSGNIFNLYNGTTATITSSWVLNLSTLNVGNGSSAMNLTIPSTASLTGTGVVNVSAGATLTLQNTSNPTLGTLNASSTVNYNGTGAQTIAAANYGNLTISGTRSGTPAITLSGTVSIAGTFSVSLSGAVTYVTTGNTIVYGATTGGKTIVNAFTYNNLTLSNSSGTNTAAGNLAVGGALTTTSGGTLNMSVYTLNVTGSPSGAGTIRTQNTSLSPVTTGKTWGGTVSYDATTGGQTVMAGTYNNLTLGNSSGTQTASGALTVNGMITTTSGGTLAMGANAIGGSLAGGAANDGTISTSSTTNPPYPAGIDWSSSTGGISFIRSTGSQTIPAGIYNDLTLTNSSGTNTASGILTINGHLTTTSGGTMAMSSNAMAGTPTSVTNNGTITTTSTASPALPSGKNWTGTTGQVTFSLTTGNQVAPAGTYKSLRFNNSSGTDTIAGAVVINGGTFRNTSGGTVYLGPSSVLSSVGTTTFTNSGTLITMVPTSVSSLPIPSGKALAGTVVYGVTTGSQTIVAEASYKTLTLSNTSGTNTAGGSITATTINIAAGGTLDMTAAYRIVSFTTLNNSGTIKTSVPTSVSSTPIPASKTWGGTVIYAAAAGSQTIVTGTYNNLTIGNTSGTNTASSTLTVNGTLTTTAGGTLDMTASYRLAGTLAGIVHAGTIKTSVVSLTSTTPIPTGKNWGPTGLIQYGASTGAQTIVAGTYYGLKVNNTSGTNTAAGTLTVNGTLTTTSGGTLNMSTFAMLGTPVAVNNNGKITTSSTNNPALPQGQDWSGSASGNVTFAVTTGGQFIPGGIYQTLALSNSSGTITAVGDIEVDGAFTNTTGGTTDMGSAYSLSGSGTFTNNGTIKTATPSSVSTAPLPSGVTWSGTVIYNALTGNQTVMDGTYKNLTLSNTSGTNTAAGDIIANAGTLITTAGGTLDMGALSVLSGTGTFTNNGIISTSVPSSLSTTPIPAGKSWGGTIVYGAPNGQQTIVSETSYNNLELSNATDTNTAATNTVVNGSLSTTAGGVLYMGALTLSGSLTGISGGGTIVTNNTSATPVASGKTWTQEIVYGNPLGGQTIVSGTYNGGLTNCSPSISPNTVVSAGSVTVGGDLNLLAGSSLSDNGVVISLSGNLAGTGSESGTGGVTMSGSGNTISGVTLSKLTLNNSSATFTMTDDLNVNGSLVISNGKLDISAYNLILGASATVSGTFSSTNMIIANGGGQVQKKFTTTGSFLFPIGDNTPSYSPITVGFTAGTFGPAAYAWTDVTNSKHPQNANTTNFINRYWSAGTSDITSATYSVSATYVPADVTGTEGGISTGEYTSSLPWIKFGATNTATHTLTTTLISATSSDITGITAAIPTMTVTPTSATVCSGTAVGLSVTGSGNPLLTYNWAPSTGLSATTGASVTATPVSTVTATTVYTVTVTDGNGFVATATSTLTVNPLPATIVGTPSACKSSTTSLSDATAGGTWSSSNTGVATIGSGTGLVTGVNVGTAFITYKLPTGCTDTDVVTINSVPSAITGTTTLCANTTTTLSDATGGVWSSSNTSVASVGSSSGVVSGVSGGTATITFTGGFSCIVTASVNVNPIASITGAMSACTGSSTSLTDATAGGTWTSSNTGVATVGSGTGLVTGVALGTASISYSLVTGCRDVKLVTINAIPSAIAGPAAVCEASTITLSDASGGTWNSSNTSVGTIVSGTGVLTGVTAGTLTVTFTSGSSCIVTASVVVNPLPGVVTGTTPICGGATTTFSDATAGGSWASSNTTIAIVGSGTGLVTGVSGGTSTISYVLSTGCKTTLNATINPVPSAIAGTAAVCTGLTTTLSNSTAGGTWSSSNTSLATIGSATGLVSGVAAGTLTISYKLNTGCASTVTFSVNALPSSISGTKTVCIAATTTLSDAGGGSWLSNSTAVATIGSSSGTVTGVAAGTSVITYTLGTGCRITAVATVLPLPGAITGTTRVCIGLTTTLSDAGGGVWTSSNTTLATIGTSAGVVSGIAPGTPTITYTLSTGCRATTLVTVNPLPASISGMTTICAGSTANLTDATAGGTWASSDITNATIGSTSGTVTGISSGPAIITYKLPTGCIATASVTVNDVPADIDGTTDVCVGFTTALSDLTSGGMWSSSDPSTASIGSTSGIVSGLVSGTATITYSDPATGCVTVTGISVDPLPTAISGDTYVCVGSVTTLVDTTDDGVWSSSNTSIADVDTLTGDVSGILAGTATITYTLSTGCLATTIVTVIPQPTAISGPSAVCAGQAATLSNSITGGNWSSANLAALTAGSSSGIVTGVSADTATVLYSFGYGCDATTTLTVNAAPSAISGSSSVCVGLTTTLSDAGGGTWSSSSTSIATVGSSTGIVSGVTAGTSTITYRLATGCISTLLVTVNPLPSAISGTKTVCSGATTTLSDAGGGTWSSGATAVATAGSSTGVVTGVTAGTATITYSLNTGCTTTAVVTVIAGPAAITGVKSVCAGLTTALSDAGGGTWTSSATTIATIGTSTGTVSGVSAGTSTITYRISNGCTATAVATVNALPSAISGTTTVCTGSATTLSDAGGGIWASSATTIATVGSSTGTVTPVLAGTSAITYTLPTGCITTTTVTVKTAPSLASATNNGPICAGVTLNLNANTPANVAGYSWTGPVAITGATTATATVPAATTAAGGTYTVTVNNGAGTGCSITYTTTATVNATPTAAPTNNSPMCTGGTVTLTANPAGSTSTYAWSGANLSSTTAQNPTATPTITATYSLTVSYSSGLPGCNPATVYTTTVTVNSLPTAAPTNSGPACSSTTVTLTANPGGSTNKYTWSGANLSSTTAQNPTATPTVTTTYSLTVSYGTGNPGCSPATVYTTTVTVKPTGYWLGATGTNWSDASNWCGGIPVITTNAVLPGSLTYYPVISTGSCYVNNITLQSGTSLTLSGGTLQVAGAISNSGTFTAGGGTIEMNGSSAQTIPAGVFASNQVNNLTANNSAGVTIMGTLQAKGIVKVAAGTLTTGGYLTLLSTSAQTALIDGSGSGSISGNVTMQRYLDTAYGYRYISSPFTAATIGGLSSYVNFTDSFPTFYRYNENLGSAGWVTDTTKTDTLKPMHGYAGNFGYSLSSKTISLTGIVNNGSVSYTIYNHDSTYTQGFNLVGNPYPSPIDWTASTGWTKTNIDNAVYYFNHSDTNEYTGTYSSYVSGVSSDGIANNIIPSMQGYFVHVSSGSYPVTGTFASTNSVRVNNLTPVYHRTTSGSTPLLRLEAGLGSDGKHADPVVVYYDAMAGNTFDNNLEAIKLMNTDEHTPNLYTVLDSKTNLSIHALSTSLPDSTQIVPLGLRLGNDGVVNFNARNIENMPAGLHIYLYDTKLGTAQDLVNNPKYKVSMAKGKYDTRFFLMFTLKDKQDIPVVTNELNAYSRTGNLFVYLVSGKGTVVVTNSVGQHVWTEELTGNGYHKLNYRFNNGIYIATMFSDMGKQSKKLFIGNE